LILNLKFLLKILSQFVGYVLKIVKRRNVNLQRQRLNVVVVRIDCSCIKNVKLEQVFRSKKIVTRSPGSYRRSLTSTFWDILISYNSLKFRFLILALCTIIEAVAEHTQRLALETRIRFFCPKIILQAKLFCVKRRL
jgi:hypothetical protein